MRYHHFTYSLSLLILAICFYGCSSATGSEPQTAESADATPETGFPFILPKEKPNRPLSAAMERNYTAYPAPRPEDNELYSQFKYTELKGLDYNGHDGTISRRDPSKVIFAKGKYYIWYTHRETPTSPKGADASTDLIPSSDWDLADIWYATSEDGFTWEEQGVAVPRPPKPQVGWRSVTTTDILEWEGKYYLYYQGFMEASGKRGDDCPSPTPTRPTGRGRRITTSLSPTEAQGNGTNSRFTTPTRSYTTEKSIFTINPTLRPTTGNWCECTAWLQPTILWAPSPRTRLIRSSIPAMKPPFSPGRKA